jgi:tRNA(fMet)-specific endonuclease VapC
MAATYLLDTTTFSDLMREHAKVASRMATLSPTGRVFICTIVRGEVCYGLERMPKGRKRRALEAKAAQLFTMLPCESVPEAAGDHYGRIKREAERKGARLDENDLWIAATALALDAVLVARDSDFQRVSGLMVENWTQ